jgi:hypothetical protein
MAQDDVYAITVVARQFGNQRLNIFHVRMTDASEPNATEFATLAVDFKDIYRTYQSNTVTYETWRARQVRGTGVTWPDAGTECAPIGGKYFEGNFTTNTAGTQAGEALPPQAALVTTLRTAEVGRAKRGRSYAYGFTETYQNGGIWDSVFMGNITANWGIFTTKYAPPIAPIHFQLGVWSFRTASGCVQNPSGKGHVRVGPSNEAQAFTDVTNVLPRNTVYTQRRRVTGAGR